MENNMKNKFFRVWNSRRIDRVLESIVEFSITDLDGEYICPSGSYLEKDYILMGYIGRDDVNGKKIYEEDILGFAYEGGDGSIFLIKWDDRKLMVTDSYGAPFYDMFELFKFKVIGNSFENLELMEIINKKRRE